MKNLYIYTLGFFMLGIIAQGYGQAILKRADEQASLYNYSVARDLYQKAYKKKKTLNAARGVAECNRKIKNYVFAESWYSKVLSDQSHTPEDEYRYAQVLISNSKYTEAKDVLQQYLSKGQNNELAKKMLEGCDSSLTQLNRPVKGGLNNMAILNSKNSDWGLVLQKGEYIFASDAGRDSIGETPSFSLKNVRKDVYGWTGANYLHIYENNGTDSVNKLIKEINGDYHTASPSFTADGKTMFYAMTTYVKKRRSFWHKEVPYTMMVAIKYRVWDDSKQSWGEPQNFPYNSLLGYSVGDPFISADGNTLFFVSDMSGGKGGTDIYYSKKDVNGKWGEPVGMSADINTVGNERTPYVGADGNFYFSSDGRAGFGGLDIYKAVKFGGDSWKVTNMGVPVNSSQDDFAPFWASGQTLYFSSDRPGGKGYDDIYRFNFSPEVPPVPKKTFILVGTVLNKTTNLPIPDAVVTLVNKNTGVEVKGLTNQKGEFHFDLDSSTDYEINVAKTDYANVRNENLTTKRLTESKTINKTLYMLQVADRSKPIAIKLENIYFDLDKSDIRPDAAVELDKLVTIFNDNPTWKIEMGSHTDSRADDAYNMKLSQRRAASTVKYLVQHGIAADRLTAKGYGETQLVNGCRNGVKCTEAEHQLNRRTEFKVLEQ
ncbi:OmpA family protein [Pinibacter soli]|uniref:OmpA family protein n=1 Tax=Pinibacter soli TaxID=3044211 RepID=A0ABT6RHZ6_9BACT|nr:OmpA family protein [Pinibacter soli]MDI3321452.1 OmpA family protein [Pinibacter soli]